ncbi:MAG: hypothetical protein J0L61_07580 [Planctomycetes bacterium]|nr:hypothetical protein [Planctomycetota bacterium]
MRSSVHRIGIGIIVALVGTPAASALIISSGASARPSESYVGLFGGGTAVAVGPRTILTAAHVGGGKGSAFVLGNTTYSAVSTITSDTADLMSVTLDRDLPGWYPIAGESVRRGARLTIAGFGLTSDGASRNGFTWSDDRAEMWGLNRLDSAKDGHLFFRFDRSPGRQEAILTPGDSGGAVFITGPGGELQLVGINRGIYQRAYGRATFGDTSVAVDLTRQGAFIAGLNLVPTPGAAVLATVCGVFASRRRR